MGKKYKDGKNQRTFLRDFEIKQIIDTFNNRKEIQDFSALVKYSEIKKNKNSFKARQYFKLIIEENKYSENEFLSILNGYKTDISQLFGIDHLCVEAIKTIFDYWFLQYEFPNQCGKSYKASGGEMVYDKRLDKNIPKGWEVCQLIDKCSILLGGTPDTSVEEYWDGNIPWLSSGEIAQFPIRTCEKNITELGMQKSATSFAEKGSILLSITRYIRASILAFDACFNQSVVAIKPSEELPTVFLYPFIESKIPLYMNLRTGAQQPHINKGTVEETWIAVPPKDVMSLYLKYTEKIYEDILQATKEQAKKILVSDFEMPGLLNK